MIIFVVVVAFGKTYVLRPHLIIECTAVSRYTSHEKKIVVEIYMLPYKNKIHLESSYDCEGVLWCSHFAIRNENTTS